MNARVSCVVVSWLHHGHLARHGKLNRPPFTHPPAAAVGHGWFLAARLAPALLLPAGA